VKMWLVKYVVTRLWAGQLRNHRLIPSRSRRFLSSLYHLHQLWVALSLLFRRQ